MKTVEKVEAHIANAVKKGAKAVTAAIGRRSAARFPSRPCSPTW